MSGGGSSSTDPYHEKDPPKKQRKQPLDPSELPTKPIGPVKIIPLPSGGKRTIRGWGYCKLYWYRCDNCGEIYPRQKRKHTEPRGFCGPDCRNKWKSEYGKGRELSEDHKRKIGESNRGKTRSAEARRKVSNARKELYKDPAFRKRMEKASNTPEAREKNAASKRGPRNPNWKGGPSKRKRVPTPADDYRESPEWRSKSEEFRERENHTCSNCGMKTEKGDGQLDVHHTYPLNDWINDGNNPCDYPDEWLVCLCKSCHSKAENQPGPFKYPPDGN